MMSFRGRRRCRALDACCLSVTLLSLSLFPNRFFFALNAPCSVHLWHGMDGFTRSCHFCVYLCTAGAAASRRRWRPWVTMTMPVVVLGAWKNCNVSFVASTSAFFLGREEGGRHEHPHHRRNKFSGGRASAGSASLFLPPPPPHCSKDAFCLPFYGHDALFWVLCFSVSVSVFRTTCRGEMP